MDKTWQNCHASWAFNCCSSLPGSLSLKLWSTSWYSLDTEYWSTSQEEKNGCCFNIFCQLARPIPGAQTWSSAAASWAHLPWCKRLAFCACYQNQNIFSHTNSVAFFWAIIKVQNQASASHLPRWFVEAVHPSLSASPAIDAEGENHPQRSQECENSQLYCQNCWTRKSKSSYLWSWNYPKTSADQSLIWGHCHPIKAPKAFQVGSLLCSAFLLQPWPCWYRRNRCFIKLINTNLSFAVQTSSDARHRQALLSPVILQDNLARKIFWTHESMRSTEAWLMTQKYRRIGTITAVSVKQVVRIVEPLAYEGWTGWPCLAGVCHHRRHCDPASHSEEILSGAVQVGLSS